MLSDDLIAGHNSDDTVTDPQLDGGADVIGRDRVAGRAEPDTTEPVDLADRDLADLGSQRRQRAQQGLLGHQAVGGNGADLGVHLGVDLLAPDPGSGVGAGQVSDREGLGNHEVGLDVADQVLDQPLALRIIAFAEIGAEPIMRREAHIGRGRDHQPGDRATLQTTHPVGQRHPRHPPKSLEALGQSTHGRLGAEVVGEAHEPDSRPGQHSAEHEQRADLPPIKSQHLPRRPESRAATPMILHPPSGLGLGHQTAEVPGRPLIAGHGCDRQQPLGGNPPLGPLHRGGDQVGDPVIVVLDRLAGPAPGPPGGLD
jgi:hypothetical protein